MNELLRGKPRTHLGEVYLQIRDASETPFGLPMYIKKGEISRVTKRNKLILLYLYLFVNDEVIRHKMTNVHGETSENEISHRNKDIPEWYSECVEEIALKKFPEYYI